MLPKENKPYIVLEKDKEKTKQGLEFGVLEYLLMNGDVDDPTEHTNQTLQKKKMNNELGFFFTLKPI